MRANKVALVTGAARRVGRVIAARLHRLGYDLVVHYRGSAAEAETLVAELEAERPDSALAVAAELGDLASLAALVETTVAHFGGLDALVNNASSYFRTPVGSATDADWQSLFDSNARGPFFLAQAALPHLAARRGAIVNITDIYAERPLPEFPIYSMAKAALAMMTQALARELGPQGIRVNAVAPGTVLWSEQPNKAETGSIIAQRTCLGEIGEPEDVAGAVAWLLTEAHYITGQTLRVDGGRSTFL